MAMGFIGPRWFGGCAERRSVADFTRAALLCLCWAMAPAQAAEVGLAGLFPGKALLTINGGPPRIVSVGATTEEGVKVVSTEGDTATIEVDGKKRVMRVGQNVASQASAGGAQQAILTANAAGHFLVNGSINGSSVRFMVDTGATTIGLGASDARRMGIDTSRGEIGYVETANGRVQAAHVKLDTVRVGDITMNNVDATVLQRDMPNVLLGMSFLNRMEMQRNGDTMTLKKRY
jgi:aspartyl protease family protein